MAGGKLTVGLGLDGSSFTRGLGNIKKEFNNFAREAPKIAGRGISLGAGALGVGSVASIIGGQRAIAEKADTARMFAAEAYTGKPLEAFEGYALERIGTARGMPGLMENLVSWVEGLERQGSQGLPTLMEATGMRYQEGQDKLLTIKRILDNWENIHPERRRDLGLDPFRNRLVQEQGISIIDEITRDEEKWRRAYENAKKSAEFFRRFTEGLTNIQEWIGERAHGFHKGLDELPGWISETSGTFMKPGHEIVNVGTEITKLTKALEENNKKQDELLNFYKSEE